MRYMFILSLLHHRNTFVKNQLMGTPLVVPWLRLHAPEAEALALIPHQGTRSHMPQLRLSAAK